MGFNTTCIILITIDLKRKLRKNELFIFGIFRIDMTVDQFNAITANERFSIRSELIVMVNVWTSQIK